MALEIKQGFEYQGKDWWKWWVWVDGPEQELDRIEYVEYTLHSSFPKPVRQITDRSSKFRLETAGWGVFTIYIKVVYKGGEKTFLEHDLELLYPDGNPTTA